MPNLEKKLLCFVQKHIAVLGIVCLLLVSAALRYFLLPYHSIDYVAALEVWYENFRSFGGWRALARDVGNYNMLYRTLMAAISYLPNPLVSIKLVSILFDYIGAAAAALLAHEVCRQAGRTAAAARRSAAAAGIVVLFLPSVVMNGAMWAQCDMMYVTFLLLCALFFYKEKYVASVQPEAAGRVSLPGAAYSVCGEKEVFCAEFSVDARHAGGFCHSVHCGYPYFAR